MTTSFTTSLGSSQAATDAGLRDYGRWMAEHGLSRNTIDQRLTFFESRLRDWGTFALPAYVVTEWVNGFTGWTRYTYLNHLRSIYKWLCAVDPEAQDPLARFRQPRTPRPHATPLNNAELEAILTTADRRLMAWIMLGYLAGLRAHEIAKFRGEHMNQDTIYVLGKGEEEALVPTHPTLWLLAQSFPREGYWFPSPLSGHDHISSSCVSNTVRDHFRSFGIRSGSVHRLRHTYGTHLSRNGVPTRVIQELLRHRQLNTTEMYIGVANAELMTAVRTLAVPGHVEVASLEPKSAGVVDLRPVFSSGPPR